jgi:hypothetical protein
MKERILIKNFAMIDHHHEPQIAYKTQPQKFNLSKNYKKRINKSVKILMKVAIKIPQDSTRK